MFLSLFRLRLLLSLAGPPLSQPRGVDGSRMQTDLINCLQDERHSYEKCQYDEFKKRVAKMDELRESKDGARSN